MDGTRLSLSMSAGLAMSVVASGVFLHVSRSQAAAPVPAMSSPNLVRNPGLDQLDEANGGPAHFDYTGAARWVVVGYPDEIASSGITLESFNEKGSPSGEVSQLVRGIDQSRGRWVRFTFRGLAEEGFRVEKDQLFMKLQFFAKGGVDSRDAAERLIYREVEKDRRALDVNGNYGRAGAAVWRTYEFEELLPFPEVDAVRVSVGFKNGAAKSGKHAAFFVDDFSLTQQQSSSRGLVEPRAQRTTASSAPAAGESGLISLGGRWYYRPTPGEEIKADAQSKLVGLLTVSEDNADRLYYRDDRMSSPFAGNMSSWLRKGHLDRDGKLVTKDRFVPDNVTLLFDGSDTLTVKAKNIPNHPTARFPDTYGTQGYNPSYIQEHDYTYYLPLNPVPNPQTPTVTTTENRALPMGSIGFAINGVVFYNPFDAGMRDASSIMDRCCGHPSPDNRYHYHKYPICVNTPFIDRGEGHSPIIGFAFDGIPVYGPYESAGIMAKEAKTHPLNAFNAHQDSDRGWHYHVTPGQFPYIIGGYFGQVDPRNFQRGRPGGGAGRPRFGPM